MIHLRQLKDQLQERKARIFGSGYITYLNEVQYFLHFLHSNVHLNALLKVLEKSRTVDFDEWLQSNTDTYYFQFPDTEEGRAKVCYGLLDLHASDANVQGLISIGTTFSTEKQFDLILQDFTKAVVFPLVDFLNDQIEDNGHVLYCLERFKLKSEWFRRKELHQLYKEDMQHGEFVLDRELRASLFDEGIDYPFSQPSSPSGEVDVAALLETEDPMVLEIKIFDPDYGRGKSHLKQGFNQVLRYANDYNKSTGYLVIFNCTKKQLAISPDETPPLEFPPSIVHAGKTIFVIPIDIHPDMPSASKESPKGRQHITYQGLTGI